LVIRHDPDEYAHHAPLSTSQCEVIEQKQPGYHQSWQHKRFT